MPTTRLDSILSNADLTQAVTDGFVRQQTSIDGYTILNYTEQAVYTRTWTDVTRQCRGIIVTPSGHLAARPWPKFFNYGEHEADSLDLAAPVEVTDKADGSLGILHRDAEGRPRIATRGSFTSAQAIWATRWFNRYANYEFFDIANKTYLFEILAHWNRIVVRYDWEGLVLLSILDTETGRHEPLPDNPWLLQARTPRDDAREHAGEERLEHVPGMHTGEPEEGLRQDQRSPRGIRKAVEAGQPREVARACPQGIRDVAGGDGGCQGEPMYRLRRDIPRGVHGFRPRQEAETAGSVQGAQPQPVPGGDREMRTDLRELPSEQNQGATGGAPQAFRIIQRFDYHTLADALAAPPRPNAEGLVVRYLDGAHAGTMVKLKQDDYVRLHRIVTGMTARRLWERAAVWDTIATDGDLPVRRIGQSLKMSADDVTGILDAGRDWLTEIKKIAPEEFTDWIDATTTSLHEQAQEVVGVVEGEALGWGDCDDRATIAKGIADHPFRGLVFAELDGKPWRAQAWAQIRPDAERPYAARGEDVA